MQTTETRAAQEGINAADAACYTPALLRNLIVATADEAHAQYPQYAGHWNGPEWQLGEVARQVRTKSGVAFRRGDIVLFRERTEEECRAGCAPGFVTAYSVRNGIDTSVPAGYVHAITRKGPFRTIRGYRHPEGLVTLTGAA